MSVSFQRFDIFSKITPWQIVVKCVIFLFFRSRQEKEVISLKKLILITIMIIIITIIVSYIT